MKPAGRRRRDTTYTCRPDVLHVRPCGPVSRMIPYAVEMCTCGCDITSWCLVPGPDVRKAGKTLPPRRRHA
jgi:hypothetical protein